MQVWSDYSHLGSFLVRGNIMEVSTHYSVLPDSAQMLLLRYFASITKIFLNAKLLWIILALSSNNYKSYGNYLQIIMHKMDIFQIHYLANKY